MKEYTFLMEVRKKKTMESLLEPEVYQTTTDDLYYALHRYVDAIQKRIKYEPKLRAKLSEIDWYVDGVQLTD